jgi:hypothetical protein
MGDDCKRAGAQARKTGSKMTPVLFIDRQTAEAAKQGWVLLCDFPQVRSDHRGKVHAGRFWYV